MNSRILAAATLTFTMMLSACADPELTALENYLTEGEAVGTEMSEAGTQFETLMNLQGNMAAWTQSEKDELQSVLAKFTSLKARAQAMTPPAILADIHPILLEAIDEMNKAVEGVATVAENPARGTDAFATEIEAHASKGEDLANEYLQKMEAAINEAYPELQE